MIEEYPALSRAILWCIDNSVSIPYSVLKNLAAIGVKTEAYYARVLRNLTKKLYNGTLDETEWVMTFSDLVSGQFRRAWYEGMRQNGLDPEQDMTEEWQAILDEIVRNERGYIVDFGDAILDAKANGSDIQPLLDRTDIWVDRYGEIVDRARIVTANREKRYKWVWGATEEHCATCRTLNGVVATAGDWAELEARGIYPRSPDLECHGYRCLCERVETDEPLTEGGIPNV